ncbi:hypothetical protein IWQ56_001405 [Coemansia nantahalensis]|uniref:Uncharacterized protein n=3 Tax=Coemansia TaxID=4863 RepID=A0ACC1LD44_9FUNG|nr:hypothetical protein IWQ57_004044 [Coemansia nantahalensis]KAJ2769065.1 hypothetical protein IWQ57_003266 [Coemansia nantahalensis]KAJ2772370.1 hypothetical protein IWQ56_001405 [Coemansia nantahalensis]KAJ2806290.1 hypothetical protein H4R21_000933 [Coemansia helicoidea]
MQLKTLAFVAAVGQATATLDLLTHSQLSERLFGLSTEQVKNIDRAVQEAAAPIAQVAGQIARNLSGTSEEILATGQKVVRQAVQAVHQALTPDVRAKIRTGVSNAVKTTLDTYL